MCDQMYWPLLPESRTLTHAGPNRCMCTIWVLRPKKWLRKIIISSIFYPPSPPLLLLPPYKHSHMHTHSRTHQHLMFCWDRAEEVGKYLTTFPTWTFASERPAAALEVARLPARAPADPYQPLRRFNSLHIHDTSTYSSCKMQMPFSL